MDSSALCAAFFEGILVREELKINDLPIINPGEPRELLELLYAMFSKSLPCAAPVMPARAVLFPWKRK